MEKSEECQDNWAEQIQTLKAERKSKHWGCRRETPLNFRTSQEQKGLWTQVRTGFLGHAGRGWGLSGWKCRSYWGIEAKQTTPSGRGMESNTESSRTCAPRTQSLWCPLPRTTQCEVGRVRIHPILLRACEIRLHEGKRNDRATVGIFQIKHSNACPLPPHTSRLSFTLATCISSWQMICW